MVNQFQYCWSCKALVREKNLHRGICIFCEGTEKGREAQKKWTTYRRTAIKKRKELAQT